MYVNAFNIGVILFVNCKTKHCIIGYFIVYGSLFYFKKHNKVDNNYGFN